MRKLRGVSHKMRIMLFLAFLVIISSVTSANAEQEEFDEAYVEYIMGFIENIEKLLNETKEEYALGNKESAMKLATEAYLDNYEFIETELAQYNEELIEEVEWMMREELRGMIRDGAPVSDVENKVDEILIRINDISTIVPEFGSMVMLILIMGLTVSFIAIRNNRLSVR